LKTSELAELLPVVGDGDAPAGQVDVVQGEFAVELAITLPTVMTPDEIGRWLKDGTGR